MKIKSSNAKRNLNIFLTYNLVTVIIGTAFAPLIPVLLNYPPGSINTPFDIKHSGGIPYWMQYIIIISLILTLLYILFKLAFRGADTWKDIERALEANDLNRIIKIRKKSFNMPHIVYILQTFLPLIFIGILFIVLGFNNQADIKFFTIYPTILSFAAVISYLFSKKYFRNVLKHTSIADTAQEGIRIGLPLKIFLQIFPLFLLSVLFTVFVGQSGIVKEKGDAVFKSYKQALKEFAHNIPYVESKDQLEPFLKEIKEETEANDVTFYIAPNGEYATWDGVKFRYTSSNALSEFFIDYTKQLAFADNRDGHTYDYWGSDVQGAVIKLKGKGGEWYLGIKYAVVSPQTSMYFLISSIALMLVALFILFYFAKTISDELSLIASGLTEIAEGDEVNLNKKIAVTSNDEIGDLADAFNKVQEREKKYIQNIKEHQKIIMERERLVSLGQMLGGITHNLKSPVASIAGFIDRLEELAVELEDTIADESVTPEDRLDIIKDLKNDLDEMKLYCSYISNLLTMVKEKSVQLNTSVNQSFTIAEVQTRIMLLMNFELKNNNCTLKTEIRLDPQSIVKGEINNLVQVINNIILNSIQAYEGQGGAIDLVIEKQENNKIVFTVTDYASGIPEEIQKKLLHEMVTTKGAKGSGLGLYLSRLTIKGRFGGDLIIRSKAGEGTTVHVVIPYQQGEESSHS
ncbi:MAG: HAMP domain-containing histidine kinase [Firmicutes bacterium]|nr:HAMP domain-containing histidine kinase [Bacillota bacterium]